MSEITKLETKEERKKRELQEKIELEAEIYAMSVKALEKKGFTREEALDRGWRDE